MSERLWDRADEFVDFAPCVDNIDFIIAPEDLGRKRTEAVQNTCGTCPVRPECIVLNTAPVMTIELKKARRPASAIWVAGQWLPEPLNAASRRELEAVTEKLVASLPEERLNRSEKLL